MNCALWHIACHSICPQKNPEIFRDFLFILASQPLKARSSVVLFEAEQQAQKGFAAKGDEGIEITVAAV